MKIRFLSLLAIGFISLNQGDPAQGADLAGLTRIFETHFEQMYEPRRCGMNVYRLAERASREGVDLTGAYALKITGAGFLETSGFYTPRQPQQRGMLGYFHWVLVAEGHVFDFDLNERLVLPVYEYMRLQFTPPSQPFIVFGSPYDPLQELPFWKLERMELRTLLVENTGVFTWARPFNEVIDLQRLMRTPRPR